MDARNLQEEEAVVSIFTDPITRGNLISVCILWSSAGFVTYLLLYYTKYSTGNFYINYAMQGCSDIISMGYINFLEKRCSTVKKTLNVLIQSVLFFTILQLCITEIPAFKQYTNFQTLAVPLLYLAIRMNVGSI